MKFGLFLELQIPRPWHPDLEHQLFKQSLEQVSLADRLGLDYVWATEHHFLEEYAHSSAPEVFLAACSQRTSTIRLGHGIIQSGPWINHPARVAERVATLDLVSDGRCELGTGEGATETELGGFNVAQAEKRAQWLEGLAMVARMLVEEPFGGHEGKYLRMPARNVVPKPLQKPHPPLWLACSRRETIVLAARLGLGALTFAFATPEESGQWVHEYHATLEAECSPIGYAVNPQIAVTCPFMCLSEGARAQALSKEHHGFFIYGLGHYTYFGEHHPGQTDLWRNYKTNPGDLSRIPTGDRKTCVGTPSQVRAQLREFERSGVDQVILLMQAGRMPHDVMCEALELFARTVMPEFKERDQQQTLAKAARAERISAVALARKQSAPAPTTTVIRAAGHH
ncbi:MAG TPA: LLM class flavin-dependent oxidoreductase [Candidatus Binataceae bacterium]|nr:LLM class flavin-dependent oxidoreductase [Candidatus Binataceae bacterium]